MDRGDRSRDVRRDPATRGRRPLGARRRLVGRTGLQHPERRVVRPPGSHRPALLPREVRANRDGWLQRRSVRSQRNAPPAPATERHGQLRLHAARPARAPSSRPRVLVGIRRWVAGPRVPPAARVLLATRGPRLPPRQDDRPAPRSLDRDDGVLWRREPRWRADARESRQHPPARRRRRDAAPRPQHAASLLRCGPRRGRIDPGRRRRPATPCGRLLLRAFGREALDAPDGECARRCRDMGDCRLLGGGHSLSPHRARPGLEAGPVQPVP